MFGLSGIQGHTANICRIEETFEKDCSEVRWEDVSTEVGLCLEARKSVK